MSDSDGWDVDDDQLDLSKIQQQYSADTGVDVDEDEDGDWEVKLPPAPPPAPAPTPTPAPPTDDRPMILVDLTHLDETIHSRFDRNSVSDPEKVSAWRKKIVYQEYAGNHDLIAAVTFIPCKASAWKEALARMRDERAGHYFIPIFPPKQE